MSSTSRDPKDLSINPDFDIKQDNKGPSVGTLDLSQSRYNFNYLVFPNDLGMDDNGHYMIININAPIRNTNSNKAATRYEGPQYNNSYLFNEVSKVDRLRYGQAGSNSFVVTPLNGPANNGDRAAFSIPRRTRRVAESIALHMPTPLIFNSHNAYEEVSLTSLAGKVGVGASAAIAGLFAAGGTAIEAITRGLGVAQGARRILDAIGNNAGTVTKVLQSPINPAVEILFANTLVRQFTIELLMAPRNEQESINMKTIIKTLKFHAAPELNFGGFFWIPPAEFDITFYNKGVENLNILRINTCVMERIEVDYAPTGVYSTFRNGHPVAARLSMGFRELEVVHKKRALQGF